MLPQPVLCTDQMHADIAGSQKEMKRNLSFFLGKAMLKAKLSTAAGHINKKKLLIRPKILCFLCTKLTMLLLCFLQS